MSKRKGLTTKISPNNQSLIKYVYYNYDPAEISSLKFTFDLDTCYLKGDKAGEIILINNQNTNGQHAQQLDDNSKPTELKFSDTGSVERVSSSLQRITCQQSSYYRVKKQIQKKPMLQLFQMRLCQHLPEQTILKKLLLEQNKLQQNKESRSRKVQRVDPIYCQTCGERLYYFYLPEQKSIKLSQIQKQFQIENSEQELKSIEWNVMQGETFTKTTEIANFNDKQFFLPENGKISFLLSWNDLEYERKDTVVLRYRQIYCQHEKIQSNVCQYCFEEVDPVQLNLKKFLFQMEQKDDFKRSMITTGSTLIQQQNKFIDELIQKEKGILILDLDNTVLHSIQMGQIHANRLQQMQEFYQLMIGHQIFNKYLVASSFVVKMRPYFRQFIETAIKYYQIYVYTKGTRSYAEQICNAIRNQYASKDHLTNNKNQNIKYYEFLKDNNAFTPSRIITRDEDPDLEKKSLNNILPTRQQNLMVMDDLGSVWSYSSAVLYTVPYHYFFKKRVLDAQKSKKNNHSIKRNNHQALDQHKQGQKLQPVEDLHVGKDIQPVRELPCDHFERQIKEVQNDLISPVRELPCHILEKQLRQIQQQQVLMLNLTDSNSQIIEQLAKAQYKKYQTNPNFIEITQRIIPEDKEYEYDILPRDDFYLIYATFNLIQIHKKFFSLKKAQKSNEKRISLANVHRKLKNELLEGTTIKFCMKNQNKIDIYGRAIKLGCEILPMDSEETPKYIIRLNNLKSNVSRMYFKKEEEKEREEFVSRKQEIENQTIKRLKFYSQTLKVPVVSESWIDFCYSFTYKFPIEPFIIDSEDILRDIEEESFEWVISSTAAELLGKIRQKNENRSKQGVEQVQES